MIESASNNFGNSTDGKMTKLVITPYSKPKEDGTGGSKNGASFIAVINPASLSLTKKIVRETMLAPVGKNATSKLSHYEPDKLSFELILDGTGLTLRGGSEKLKTVTEQLRDLEATVYHFQREAHQSNYMEIKWGEFLFRGYLTSFTINHTLFDSDGNSLRARVQLGFSSFVPVKDFEEASPDMTHVRFVNSSDTLEAFCKDIYGDERFVVHVAAFNGLKSFRQLPVGQRLEFPPLINKSNG